jgi:RNA polymerase sigma factor (sigma-70 family)
MRAVTDEQLIQWVADGDTSCLATLFERHYKAVYQFCLQMTRHPAESEDLVQDVFIKILRKAGTFRGEGLFKAWMFNIARNITLDHIRKSKRRHSESLDDEMMNEKVADQRSAEQSAAATQKMNLVMQALAKLPQAAQQVIWLGRFQFENYDELGQALGCKAGTARVKMHRAMTLLNSTYISINGAPIDV